MKLSLLSRSTLLMFGVLASAALLPASADDAPPERAPGRTAAPVYLRLSSPAVWHSTVAYGGRLALHQSTKNSNPGRGGMCSVESDPINPPACSSVAQAKPCSAANDAEMRCSVFASPNRGNGSCSTNGAAAGLRCSALGMVSPTDASACSTFVAATGMTFQCSVQQNAAGYFCSSDNMGTKENTCSTHEAAGGTAQCSVFQNNTSTCSITGNPRGPNQCSAFFSDTACSIVPAMQQRSSCTAYNGAQAGTCSVHAQGAHCSVIGGPDLQPGRATCP